MLAAQLKASGHHDDVISLVAQGYSRRAIAAKLGIGEWRVRTIAERHGLPTQTDLRQAAPTISEQVRDALRSGLSRAAAAEKFAITRVRVDKIAHRFQDQYPELRRPRYRPASGPVQIPVPAWARDAGLADDYRDHARIFGEIDAARHCRKLKAEAQEHPAIIKSKKPASGSKDWANAVLNGDVPTATLRDVIRAVGVQFGYSYEEIVGPHKHPPLVRARWAAIHAVRKARPGQSWPETGRIFGGRDHTTIINAVRKMEAEGVPQPDGSLLPLATARHCPTLAAEARLGDLSDGGRG